MERRSAAFRVAVTGASGLIGRALSAALTRDGHEVLPLPRGDLDPGRLTGVDAVVNLAGAGLADRRWTEARKREIRDSRVALTSRLVETLARLPRRPRALLSASAVGYYGSRPDPVEESSPSGDGFLASVCREWEAAAAAASRAGIRVVHLRFGVVLDRSGGALAKMLPAFRLGLGGPIGSGSQGFSWVVKDDAIRAIRHLLAGETLSGPFNVVAPEAVPQRELARRLGRALGRPAVLPLPAVAVKALFGEMGEEALLGGCFARPVRLSASGFRCEHPTLDGALEHALGPAG